MIDCIKKKKYNHIVLYHECGHNQLMNVYEDESKKQWINLPPQEDKDLQQFINLYRLVFGVKYSSSTFWHELHPRKFF